MDSILFRYSQFFDDDGGMKKVLDDFTKLGDNLVDEAKRVKKEMSSNFNFDDIEGFKKMEARIEELTKANEDYAKAQANLTKIVEDFEKAQKKQIDNSEKLSDVTDELANAIGDETDAMQKNTKERVSSSKALDKLNIELEQHKLALKVVNELEKAGTITTEKAIAMRTDAKLKIKEITTEIGREERAILSLNQVSKAEQKLIQAKTTLQKEEARTIADVRERIAALRVVVQSLDLETEAEKIRTYNQEIDDLTEVLSDNSDQFIQNKINIGNYEESIKNALKSSSLFKTNIGVIDSALESFGDTLLKTRKEAEEMETALGNNATALQRFQIAFGKMNNVLKASVIGAVIVAIAALASMFGNTRQGAANTEKAMLTLSNSINAIGLAAKALFVDGFKAFFFATTLQFNKANESAEKAAKGIAEAFKNNAEAVVKGFEFIDEAFRIEDRVRSLNRELEKTNGRVALLQAKADDSTRSMASMLAFSKLARVEQEKTFLLQSQVAQQQLEAINNRIRQQAISNGLAGSELDINKSGLAFAEQTQALAQRKGASLKLDNALIEEQHNAMLEIQKIENETALAREENSKQQRQINQDIFEQNLDLLIDIIDVQKNLSEAFVNDITKNTMKRVQEFESFIKRFRENAQDEIEEFNTLFEKQAATLGTKAPKFKLEFDEAGNAKVFLDGVLLSTEQAFGKIKELNEQLKLKGIAEIPINRFRGFLVETGNAKRDFDALAISVANATNKFLELKNNLAVTKLEDTNLQRINDRINELSQLDLGSIPRKQRLKAVKELEDLQKERENVLKDGDANRKENRIQAISRELRAVQVQVVNGEVVLQRVIQKGSQRQQELLQERADLQRELQEEIAQDRVKSIEEENAKAEAAYQKFVEDVQNIISLVFDKVIEMQQKIVQQQESLLEKQGEMVDKQEQRAQQGLANTLAFEQKALAQREAELLKAQKKQERLEKIKALYTSYTNYANKGDENPILKALRDFAILESITASFGDGGVVEDKLPSSGIFRGQSHNGNQGGIPIRVEGKEGIFSVREMSNLGKDNFYRIKEMAGNGKIDENFFSRQRQNFIQAVIPSNNTSELKESLKDVKRAIDNKPVQNWRADEVVNGVLTLIEETQSGNKTKRLIYKIQKPKL